MQDSNIIDLGLCGCQKSVMGISGVKGEVSRNVSVDDGNMCHLSGVL